MEKYKASRNEIRNAKMRVQNAEMELVVQINESIKRPP